MSCIPVGLAISEQPRGKLMISSIEFKRTIQEELIPLHGTDSKFMIPNALESKNWFFLELIPGPENPLYTIR